MWKKVTLGAFALLLGLLANTHLVCRVSINGEQAEGSYSPWVHDRGLLAAEKAALEILAGETSLPVVKTGCGLSLRPPSGSAAELSGAVLDSVSGIALLDGVFVNSVPLGKVENGESAEVAICREFDEEFSVPVTVGPKIAQAVFQYNGKDIQLEGYEIFLATDNPQWILTEHTEIRWVTFDEIKELHFVDSDLLIYPQVVDYFARKEGQ